MAGDAYDRCDQTGRSRDALEADTIISAVPFGEHLEVATALPSWKGKTVIDAMNALD
jgi:8-hydroxy-5-deazaflavin:NADPH oxidoreductase